MYWIRLGRANVRVGIRRRIVQVHVEGPRLEVIVPVAADISAQAQRIPLILNCLDYKIRMPGEPRFSKPLLGRKRFTREGRANGRAGIRRRTVQAHAEGPRSEVTGPVAADRSVSRSAGIPHSIALEGSS